MIVKGHEGHDISVSTAFKVHYNQKLGEPTRPFGGGERTMAFGGDRRPFLKEPVEGECLMFNGMEFQTVAAAYLKASRPHAQIFVLRPCSIWLKNIPTVRPLLTLTAS